MLKHICYVPYMYCLLSFKPLRDFDTKEVYSLKLLWFVNWGLVYIIWLLCRCLIIYQLKPVFSNHPVTLRSPVLNPFHPELVVNFTIVQEGFQNRLAPEAPSYPGTTLELSVSSVSIHRCIRMKRVNVPQVYSSMTNDHIHIIRMNEVDQVFTFETEETSMRLAHVRIALSKSGHVSPRLDYWK